ncbi:hypothetical protein DKX38_018229 [Salix brachista]|uniref:Uncharacterized protein n=1 Tax=Salix brachista TaxID=2182728 RepID=A0A5N5KMH1_9ROSI|nr:hypothetical protein DKX38_018229 [Salix brachista]
MFLNLKWYYVVVAYILAPSLSFCIAYGAGLTDMNMTYNYGKVALFLLAAMARKNNGVVAGLVGCGVIKSIVSISSDLMHDFKTGHLTLTSPKSMLLSQAIGTVIGCVVAPFYKVIIGVEGFSALPQHCLQLCYGFTRARLELLPFTKSLSQSWGLEIESRNPNCNGEALSK